MFRRIYPVRKRNNKCHQGFFSTVLRLASNSSQQRNKVASVHQLVLCTEHVGWSPSLAHRSLDPKSNRFEHISLGPLSVCSPPLLLTNKKTAFGQLPLPTCEACRMLQLSTHSLMTLSRQNLAHGQVLTLLPSPLLLRLTQSEHLVDVRNSGTATRGK